MRLVNLIKIRVRSKFKVLTKVLSFFNTTLPLRCNIETDKSLVGREIKTFEALMNGKISNKNPIALGSSLNLVFAWSWTNTVQSNTFRVKLDWI